MLMPSKIKRVFPGGNTSKGFFSYYDYLIEKDANRIFVIKGGPGVGKSSMMKHIGNVMLDKGYDVEFHHCSSDNNSLDGLVIPKLRVAMVDGTAPHIVDPKNPGAVDEIIHLGDYWDVEKMEGNKKEIIACNNEVGRLFERAYKFLAAAKPIYDDIVNKHKEAMDFSKANSDAKMLINEIFRNVQLKECVGKDRHLFGSAITPEGFKEYTNSILSFANKVYYIKGDVGTGKSRLLKKIYKTAISNGLNVEVYHTPFVPEKIETVLIPELKIGITTSDMYKTNSYKIVDLDSYLNKDILRLYKEEIEYDKSLMNDLINYAIGNIKKAKTKHDEMETYYIPHMNFDEMEKVRVQIINRILAYDK